jgi:hypothetical protein
MKKEEIGEEVDELDQQQGRQRAHAAHHQGQKGQPQQSAVDGVITFVFGHVRVTPAARPRVR